MGADAGSAASSKAVEQARMRHDKLIGNSRLSEAPNDKRQQGANVIFPVRRIAEQPGRYVALPLQQRRRLSARKRHRHRFGPK